MVDRRVERGVQPRLAAKCKEARGHPHQGFAAHEVSRPSRVLANCETGWLVRPSIQPANDWPVRRLSGPRAPSSAHSSLSAWEGRNVAPPLLAAAVRRLVLFRARPDRYLSQTPPREYAATGSITRKNAFASGRLKKWPKLESGRLSPSAPKRIVRRGHLREDSIGGFPLLDDSEVDGALSC